MLYIKLRLKCNQFWKICKWFESTNSEVVESLVTFEIYESELEVIEIGVEPICSINDGVNYEIENASINTSISPFIQRKYIKNLCLLFNSKTIFKIYLFLKLRVTNFIAY